MTHEEYWMRRQLEHEARWHELTTTELRKLKRYYVKATADIERDVAASKAESENIARVKYVGKAQSNQSA